VSGGAIDHGRKHDDLPGPTGLVDSEGLKCSVNGDTLIDSIQSDSAIVNAGDHSPPHISFR
jgi:hypothetical protein